MKRSSRTSPIIIAFSLLGVLSLGGCRFSDWRAAGKDLYHRLLNLTSPVLAQVGNQTITLEDLKEFVQRLPPAFLPLRVTPQGRKNLLQQLIQRRILLIAAAQSGLPLKPLANLSDEDRVLSQFQQRLFSTQLAVTDAEATAYYKQHQDQFSGRAEISARRILVASSTQAQKVKAALKKKSFEAVAREMSIDKASAMNGGHIHFDFPSRPTNPFEK